MQVKTLRHTAEVLCLKFNSLRVVSGSVDGKVRIWNMRTADCIRIFRGNSHCDPIVSLSFGDNNSICVNTKTSMQVLYFESSQEERDRSPADVRSTSMSKQLLSDRRIQNYKKQAPMLRSRSSISFAGQWRATDDGRVRLSQGQNRTASLNRLGMVLLLAILARGLLTTATSNTKRQPSKTCRTEDRACARVSACLR